MSRLRIVKSVVSLPKRFYTQGTFDDVPPVIIPDPFTKVEEKDLMDEFGNILVDYPLRLFPQLKRKSTYLSANAYKNVGVFERFIRFPQLKIAAALLGANTSNRAFKNRNYFPGEIAHGLPGALSKTFSALTRWNGSEEHTNYGALSNMLEPYILQQFQSVHQRLDKLGYTLDLKFKKIVSGAVPLTDVCVTDGGGNPEIDSTILPGHSWKQMDGYKSSRKTPTGISLVRNLWIENVSDASEFNFISGKSPIIIGIDLCPTITFSASVVKSSDPSLVFLSEENMTRILDIRLDSAPVMFNDPQEFDWKIADVDRCLISKHLDSYLDCVEE